MFSHFQALTYASLVASAGPNSCARRAPAQLEKERDKHDDDGHARTRDGGPPPGRDLLCRTGRRGVPPAFLRQVTGRVVAKGQHPPSCAKGIRVRATEEGWRLAQTINAIRDHCGVSALKAHRLARGWTLAKAV